MRWRQVCLVLALVLLGGGLAPAAAPLSSRWDLYGDLLPDGAVARLGTVRWRGRPPRPVLVPGGKLLATPDVDELTLLDLKMGKQVRPLRGTTIDEVPFSRVAFTSDGLRLASASRLPVKWGWGKPPPARLSLWDFPQGKLLAFTKPLDASPGCLAVRPDGKQVACGMYLGPPPYPVLLWDTAGNTPRQVVKGAGMTIHLAYSPDGKTLTAISESYSDETLNVRRIDIATEKAGDGFKVGRGARSVLSPDGANLATFNSPDKLFLYDVGSGKKRHLPLPDAKVFIEPSFSGDGKLLLAREHVSGAVQVWEVATGRLLRRVRLPEITSEQDTWLVLSLDGKTFLSGGPDWVIRRWDAQTGKPRNSEPHLGVPPIELAFSPDGRKLVAYSCAYSACASHWDVAGGQRLDEVRLQGVYDHPPARERDRFLSPGGQRMAEPGPRGVDVCETREGKWRRIGASEGEVATLAFSPDGTTLATVGKDAVIRLWDPGSGKLLRRILPARGIKEVSWVCFTPDGNKLASGEGWQTVRLWDVGSGKVLDTLRAPARRKPDSEPEAFRWRCCFSPDGRWLAASGTADLWVWDLAARREVGPFEEAEQEGRLAASGPVSFSADGRFLAWYDSGFELCLHETASGKIVHRFDSAWGTASFARSGWQVAVPCIEDGSVLLWDVGLLLRSLSLPGGTKETPADMWDLLANSDASIAHRALWRLAARADAEDFLSAHLPVVRPLPAARLATLLDDLTGADRARRGEAEEALAQAREAVQPALKKALTGSDDVELRLRLTRLLVKLEPRSPEQLRDARAVLVLEARGTPAARELLRRLAGGLAQARLTREAREALARLERRP